MITTTAIHPVDRNAFLVIWDTGRRCNYDCTYCESTRHNNYSSHKSLDELKASFDFIQTYTALYNSKRKQPFSTHINFTGGEPTVNPNFWNLVDYISTHDNVVMGLTTNGAWGKKNTQKILEKFEWVTVSYHAEAHETLKQQVIDNIFELHNSSINLSVNLMLHVDYWDECMQVYEKLKAAGIKCNPRPIGDGALTIKGWFSDSEGVMRRTSHEYTVEQQAWFWNQAGVTNPPKTVAEGNQMGRSCCGGVCLKGKVNSEWQPIKLIDTHFEDWQCMVNWYFLYIDQETKEVYHHQTCKALFDKQRGSIGNLDDVDSIYKFVEHHYNDTIVCPNPRCGCGMCAPKAQDVNEFKIIRESLVI
jgi:MoaA/NifB/PqqE/SkfB family radical SAM enzyme